MSSTRLPIRIKIFALSLVSGRLGTQVNRFAKNCSPSRTCVSCPENESSDHLFVSYARAPLVWNQLNICPLLSVNEVHATVNPATVSTSCWKDGLFVLIWHIWKVCNSVVFNNTLLQKSLLVAFENRHWWHIRRMSLVGHP
jgi:hypothetical protein